MPADTFRGEIICTAHPPASPWRYLPNPLRPPSARNRPTVVASVDLGDLGAVAAAEPAAVAAKIHTIEDALFKARAAAAVTTPRWHRCDLTTHIAERPGPGVEWGTHPPARPQ